MFQLATIIVRCQTGSSVVLKVEVSGVNRSSDTDVIDLDLSPNAMRLRRHEDRSRRALQLRLALISLWGTLLVVAAIIIIAVFAR